MNIFYRNAKERISCIFVFSLLFLNLIASCRAEKTKKFKILKVRDKDKDKAEWDLALNKSHGWIFFLSF